MTIEHVADAVETHDPDAPVYDQDGITVYAGDAIEVLRRLPDASVDSVCTDPPYGLEFMGRDWDGADGFRRSLNPADAGRDNPFGRASRTSPEYRAGKLFQQWCQAWAVEALRVLKPGGHLLAFGGSRTYHRMACAVEDAGFELRDCIAWLYGSGFPKSLDVSKAIDKAAGVDREVTGQRDVGPDMRGDNYGRATSTRMMADVTGGPVTDDAKTWDGWGTALKPAHEPIVVARKPLAGTVVGTVLTHGTGALNIDGCLIAHAGADDLAASRAKNPGRGAETVTSDVYGADRPQQSVNDDGRWPSNAILDVDQANQLDAQPDAERTSRYFLRIAETVDDLPARFRYSVKAGQDERVNVNGVAHPTVKPLELMRWLVRLVTPPGGVVCDMFAGSGTTGEACILEDFGCILIERDPTYLPLIRQRIDRRRDPVAAVKAAKRDGDEASLFDLLDGGTA